MRGLTSRMTVVRVDPEYASVMKRIIPVFRLPQTDEERAGAEASRRLGYDAPLIILDPENARRLRRLFDTPPHKSAAEPRKKW